MVAAIGARKRAVASPATANRHLALIRAILRRACDKWEWIEKAPKIKLYREAKRRVRWGRAAWMHGEDVKNGDDLHVSLNGLAMDVLRRQHGKHPERVFTDKGKPIHWANTRGWRSALVRADIANFRWHDLRHTWAS
jgi:hypothetical protein